MQDGRSGFEAALKQAARGRLSRREIMQLALASGISLAAADVMLATAQAAEPKRGGTFRLGVATGGTTDTLDPATYPDQFTGTAFWGTLSNSLTEIDAEGNVAGDLAESFEPSEDAKRWVFRLRPGLTFHDGRSVTADDVVASIEHHRGEASRSAVKALLQEVVSIKADGAGLVLVELSGGNADFPYVLSDYHMPIMPRNAGGTADWQSGIRTGAYTLDKYQPGVQATFNRNPNYHKPGRGWFERVEILSIKDMAARTNALLAGEIHYMDRCDLRTLAMLNAHPDFTVSEVTGYGHYSFAMNVTEKPFDDVNVRRAIKRSIDREDILEKVFQGYGAAGNDNPIAPTVKFAIDPEPRHAYDPVIAREHLRKAGLERLRFDLSVSDAAFAGAVDAALLWKEQAKACNIDINVIREPEDAYWENVWRKKPFAASFWFGRPTVDWMMTLAYGPGSPYNETRWTNPRFTELLLAARSETDDAPRQAMYAEMQQLVHDEGGLVNLIFNAYVEAHVAGLGHGAVAANAQLDGMRITERWWMA